MPLTRYQVRNEYGLADPELYRAADRDDPEALLEGVAMAGLVGVLRQLGDLAEFAAEIFHELHEEVMATATRGHGLMVRVQQLEADFPSIEKEFLSQANHSSFYSNPGVDWHPNLRSEQNLITRRDLPRFVMDSYEECRGPPRLFLLDKFDVAGAGACLKRYTDPSFFKVESASALASAEMQRERKIRKVKKKGARWRNGDTPDVSMTSHAKLHELFLEERIQNGYSDPARRVKLKKRHLNGDSRTRTSYLDKFVETSSPESKMICATPDPPPLLKLSPDNMKESGLRILDITTVSPAEKSLERRSASSSANDQEGASKQSMDGLNGGVLYGEILKGSEPSSDAETDTSYNNLQMVAVQKDLEVDGEDKTESSIEGYNSDDVASEVDNYVDALASMESETENESKPKSNVCLPDAEKRTNSNANEEEHPEIQAQSLASQSIGNSSDDWNNSSEKDTASLHSDTPSNSVETAPLESNATAKKFPSTEACEGQNLYVSPNQHSVIVDSLEATSNERVASRDTCIEEGINPDHFMAVVSNDSSHVKDEFRNTSARHSLDESDKEDLGVTSLPCLSKVEELASVHHNDNDSMNEAFQTQFADGNVMGSFTSRKSDSPRSCMPPTEEQPFSSAVTESLGITTGGANPDVGSSEEDDPVIPAVKPGVLPWRRISKEVYHERDPPQTHGVIDPQVSDLNDASHFEEQFNAEERSGADSMNEALQKQCTDEVDMVSFTSRKIDLPCSSIPPPEELLFSSVLTEVQTSPGNMIDVANPDKRDSEVDDPVTPNAVQSGVLPWRRISKELYPEGDAPQTHVSDINEDMSHYNEKINVEERSRSMDDDKMGLFTSNVDAEGGDSVSLELPSNCPTNSGLRDHVISENEVPETIRVEDVAVFSAVAKSDVIDTSPDALSPPLNFINLHEPPPGFGDSHQKESELDDVASPHFVADFKIPKEVNEIEIAMSDSESAPTKSVGCHPSSAGLPTDRTNVSLDEHSENSLIVCDVLTASTHLEMSTTETESQFLDQCHQEYAMSSSTSELLELETSLESLPELQANQVDMKHLQRDGAIDLLEPVSGRLLEIQSDQLDVDSSQDDQASVNSSDFQPAHIGSPNLMDKENSKPLLSMDHTNQDICLDVNSESSPEHLPGQSSTPEFLPESAAHEVDIIKEKMEPLESIFPRFVQPLVVNLEDTPPLPPLPPMQWRLGKMQPAFPASQRELVGVGHDSILPTQSLQSDGRAQFDLPAAQREPLRSSNPFLSLTSEDDMKFQPAFRPLEGNVVHPSPYTSQLPTSNSDSKYQDDCSGIGGMQYPNPAISLSSLSGDCSIHNDIALEGEKVVSKPSTAADSEFTTLSEVPVFSNGAIVQPQQFIPETGLESEALQYSLNCSEREQERPLTASVTAPTTEDQQPQYSSPTSEEEKVQSSSKPSAVPGTECITSREDPFFSLGETVQPLQQLTSESGFEPEDLRHSLRNSEGEQGKHLPTSVTTTTMVDQQSQGSLPTTMVDQQPQQTLPTSEGEMAGSSNTSDVMSDSEVGRSNGNPVNKIPRPRNPLIDAVTAHGQSKLKKASERVQSQVEPKVDERDRFLEQIRTKSFNLKPAPSTRYTPSLLVKNPPSKVISLLEKKAIAIRQAFAGSDEDEDDDSWSE